MVSSDAKARSSWARRMFPVYVFFGSHDGADIILSIWHFFLHQTAFPRIGGPGKPQTVRTMCEVATESPITKRMAEVGALALLEEALCEVGTFWAIPYGNDPGIYIHEYVARIL